jgi:myo-inositol-1(or 4)-monophosphatase
MDKILQIAKESAFQAGKAALDLRQSGTIHTEFKSPRELVTTADKKAESIIISIISKKFPDHNFLSEETNATVPKEKLTGPLWIIDPIDGTTNFAHGLQHWAVSIAYAKNGVVQVGVVYAPVLNETFVAVRGNGATLNDQKIAVSARSDMSHALVATGFPYERDASTISSVFDTARKFLEKCRDLRRLGAASLDISYIACGRMDVFYENLSPWDMAAAGLIAREAGAITGNWSEDIYNNNFPEDLKSRAYLVAGAKLYKEALFIISSE